MAHGTRYNMFWRVWLVFSWCLLAMACSDVAVPTEPAALTGGTPTSEGTSNQAMPKGLREAVKQARQEDASEVYAAVRDEVGRVALKNPAQRFATTVDANGIVVTADENPWTWSLRTTAAGCAGAERAVRESEPAVNGNRVTYGRGEFEEWYLNGPMGFEQGFTWPSAPDCAGTKSIRMQVDGDLAARLNAAGDAVELIDAEGRAVLRYADLSVKDATGKTLSAWMTVGAGEFALHWEDEGATYPVVVDPVVAKQEAKLLSGDTGAGDRFGSSVALSEDGQTAIVGAPYDDDRGTDAGAAYILEFANGSWTQTRKLTASDGGAGDYFGWSVAISGNTAIIGAYGDNDNGTDSGSAYVFVRNAMAWIQQAKLTASDGVAFDNFGFSIAFSGDTALVGAPLDTVETMNETNLYQGSAYVFVRSGTEWIEQAKLTASDGASADNFGFSVALSGDTALVGVTPPVFFRQSSVYVFVRSGTTWTEQARLTANHGGSYEYDNFGYSVAVSDDTALVGAKQDDIGTNTAQGSAYVFVRNGTTWTEKAKLTASDGAEFHQFGISVALSGDTALVGAIGTNVDQGSAYVFVKPPTGWATTDIYNAKLTASDGEFIDVFGTSVAVSGDTALAGAPLDDIETNSDQGSTYVFVKPVTGWADTADYDAKLTANDGAAFDNFGTSVALSGDMALVGVPGDDDSGLDSGTVYVFEHSGATWTKQAEIIASDGAPGDHFGESVALSGTTALVGVKPNFNQLASAYVFVRNGSIWTEQAKLAASDGTPGDYFGKSVALSGDTALVGASYDDIGTNANQGSAYVFVRNGTMWTQQAKLIANDGGIYDYFGGSVALSGDTALVAAVNEHAAYVIVRSGTTWTQQAKLTASNGAVDDDFGGSLALSGDTALVGADADDIGTNVDQGSAYIFVRVGTTWTQRAKLTANDGIEYGHFGLSVALSGDTALVGARPLQESAYVFVKPLAGWTTTDLYDAKLTAAHGFDLAVALSDDGSVGVVSEPGAAYVFSLIRSLGLSCSSAAACDSGLCVDGVCCNSPCNGPCQACAASLQELGTDGYCGPAAEGSNPGNRCPTEDPSTCGKRGTCTAVGTCAVYEYGTSCAEPVCTTISDGVVSKVCNGFGACTTNPQIEDCGTYQCTNGACNTTCATDDDCADDAYCNKNISPSECAVKKNIGEMCSPQTKECKSGFCVDGVCCDSPCLGTCQACNNLTSKGYCASAPEGTVDDACAYDSAKPCGYTGQCNAFGACELTKSDAPCGDKTCTEGVASTSTCNGNGQCITTKTACGDFACDTTACKTECSTNADCIPGAFCEGKACKLDSTLGLACTGNDDCLSGHCLELASDMDAGAPATVCCASDCTKDTNNPCGFTGKCTTVGACELPANGVKCGPSICQADIEYDEQICNGFGSCVPSPSNITSCYPRRCDDNGQRCLDTCTKDADCAEAFVCEDGNCHPKQRYCKGNFDCQENEDCDPNTLLCIPKSTSTMPAESCDCQLPGQPSSPSRWPLVAIASTLVALRRLRARNPATHHRRAA